MQAVFGILVLAVVVAAVLLASPAEISEPGPTGGRRVDLPSINIKDVQYAVSSEKPEVVVARFAAEESSGEKAGTEVTVYNQDFALVKEKRDLFLKEGVNLVKYKDVAARIDPTSVFFQDIDFPETFVLEQNYEYDLVSRDKMLEKYLDKRITVVDMEGDQPKEYTGTLLSYSGGILIQTSEGVVSVSPEKIIFPNMPENLWVKPTLIWKLYAGEEGTRQTQTTYLTDGVQWHAEYIAKVNATDTQMDFKGWVSIDNRSGTSYPETKLKLVAGDVHRVVEKVYRNEYEYMTEGAAPSADQFVEEGLFEYHMYTLGRETDVMNNQVKQISLLASEDVPVKKIFYYDGASQGTKVQTKLNYKNSEEQGLGLPLPKGKVRVYKADSQGQLQFVGEDLIDHTAKDEEVNLYLGDAFDIIGERTRVSSENVSKGLYRNSYKIELRNHKDEAAEVVVHEYVGSSWAITRKSDPFEAKSSSEIEFTVNVPANGSKTVTYTVEHRYYW